MTDDVPPGVDFHDATAALEWASSAHVKRPWRRDFFERITQRLTAAGESRVIELGSGPGFLAEFVLARASDVVEYVLLDFSAPMLELSRSRLDAHRSRSRLLLADFKSPGWTAKLTGEFQFVVSMQAVHELRHKRHASRLYAQARQLLAPHGELLICDHLPGSNPTAQREALYMTIDEHEAALFDAGYCNVECLLCEHDMALFRAMPSFMG